MRRSGFLYPAHQHLQPQIITIQNMIPISTYITRSVPGYER